MIHLGSAYPSLQHYGLVKVLNYYLISISFLIEQYILNELFSIFIENYINFLKLISNTTLKFHLNIKNSIFFSHLKISNYFSLIKY